MAKTELYNDIKVDVSCLRSKHLDICSDLNVDSETQVLSWRYYEETASKFSLEGDPVHWLCCSLYLASQRTRIPTVGGTNGDVIIGNCIRLNHLLRSCSISIYEFIEKVKIWCNINGMSTKIQYRVKRLEKKFGLTLLIFQHYKKIFRKLYNLPNQHEDAVRKWHNAKLLKKYNCYNLYDMCWLLFLCAKNEIPNFSFDLVSTYHLLICCVELIYRNVLFEKRQELINTQFNGTPKAWENEHFDTRILNDYCAIHAICSITEGIPKEATKMKKGIFQSVINNFLTSNIISGNTETLLDLTSDALFWVNFKSLNRSYEHFMLSVGDFDERILPDYALMQRSEKTKQIIKELNYNTAETPVTRRELLPLKTSEQLPGNSVDKALDNVRQLQRVECNHELPLFLRRYSNIVSTKRINDILKTMSSKFYESYTNMEEAKERFGLAQSLYYYLLEKIARAELQNKPEVCITKFLEQPIFNKMLIACCVELVLEAYNSAKHKFPWILKCFEIEAFHFYKIIEIVVLRNDGILTRELIKHLNTIEETCLEELVWQKTSIVWTLIRGNGCPLPNYQDVKSNVTVTHKSVKKNCVRSLWNTSMKQLSSVNNAKTSLDQSSSLAIFLRKIYKLSWIRLYKLCLDLELDRTALLNIWTIFENSLTYHTSLIGERHLDQLLMCAIYIYVRIENISQTKFVDIIKYYRIQPQAKSNVYRNVLLQSSINETKDAKLEYNDLIAFYNRNYVPKMTAFVVDAKRRLGKHFCQISERQTPSHCENLKRLTRRHYLYVSPMEKNVIDSKTTNSFTYEFNKSPSKFLQQMNNAVCKNYLLYDDSRSNCQCRKRPNILKCSSGCKRQKVTTF